MNFIMSYSCGKDSTLALQRMIEKGNKPIGLLVMINEDMGRSWFHGADYGLLQKISQSLEIPLILCPSQGDKYHTAFEDGLRKGKAMGAELVAFGDIDIKSNRKWCEDRCSNVAMKGVFPLWQESRRDITHEVIEKGYTCIIKSINNELLPKTILGKKLSLEIISVFEERGIDICGENGEYHTLIVDGPIFHRPLQYQIKEKLDFGKISVIDIC